MEGEPFEVDRDDRVDAVREQAGDAQLLVPPAAGQEGDAVALGDEELEDAAETLRAGVAVGWRDVTVDDEQVERGPGHGVANRIRGHLTGSSATRRPGLTACSS